VDAANSGEFFTGLQSIEREIIAKLRGRGVPVTAANFRWNRGSSLVPPPEEATLEINVHGTLAKAVFSREQVEDSHGRVDRMDVVAMIDVLVEQVSH
jgi:hypothetical protein